ncbi:hypothetical protein BD769DRAFT_1307439, partial [Suillus cothurnatus]
LPDIPWNKNEHLPMWKLIVEISTKANYKVLFGKKNQHENTSGETKASVYKHIGAVILPECYKIDPTATGDHIKSKLELLTKIYKKHAAKLQMMGEGVHEDQDHDGGDSDEFCRFYIGANGPDANSSEEAKNLWDQIKNNFLFFPDLHQI